MLENDLEYNPYWAISRLARSSVFTDKVRLTSGSTVRSFGETLAPLLVALRLLSEVWLWCAGMPGLRKPNLEEFGECCCLKLLGGECTHICASCTL